MKNRKGLRLLGGSSRFAQVKTISCGSLKFIVCLLCGCESVSRDRKAHGKIFVKNKKMNDSSSDCLAADTFLPKRLYLL